MPAAEVLALVFSAMIYVNSHIMKYKKADYATLFCETCVSRCEVEVSAANLRGCAVNNFETK
jgi:hypothetical protein